MTAKEYLVPIAAAAIGGIIVFASQNIYDYLLSREAAISGDIVIAPYKNVPIFTSNVDPTLSNLVDERLDGYISSIEENVNEIEQIIVNNFTNNIISRNDYEVAIKNLNEMEERTWNLKLNIYESVSVAYSPLTRMALELEQASSFYMISIVNRGGKPAHGVFVSIPDVLAYRNREGKIVWPETTKIDVGDLLQGESVEFVAWGDRYYPSRWSNELAIVLGHSGGIGDINRSEIVSGIFLWMSKSILVYAIATFFLIFIFPFAVILYIFYVLNKGGGKKETPNISSDIAN